MNTRTTKKKNDICIGKKSGCLYKGKPWDSHPDNPVNKPKNALSTLGKAGALSHINGLKNSGNTGQAAKLQAAWNKKYGK